ncbi:MAG: hypothetical protein R3E12_09480 [Candidatus Eisenbacteria bacterium]|uniref:Copper chaperone PCu(A)C n=1 Tax=Eiseniibacteriota bacterium TaxID=2212470 RepID=A0A956RPN3_UNCEI|nr:hypothetical protein [Candidatus Eisenbacteria bacterium]
MKRTYWIGLALVGSLAAWGFAHAGDDADDHHMMHSGMGGMMGEEGHHAEQPGHSHEHMMLHHGQVAMTEHHHFETVFQPDGVRIYCYTEGQAPAGVGKTTGKVDMKYQDGRTAEVDLTDTQPKKGDTTVYYCPGHPDATQMEPGICKQCGGMELMKQDFLFAPMDLSKVAPGSMKMTAHLKGMGGDEPEATFTETFQGMSSDIDNDHDEHDEHHEEHPDAH